jgi:hypothetical protein
MRFLVSLGPEEEDITLTHQEPFDSLAEAEAHILQLERAAAAKGLASPRSFSPRFPRSRSRSSLPRVRMAGSRRPRRTVGMVSTTSGSKARARPASDTALTDGLPGLLMGELAGDSRETDPVVHVVGGA